MALNLGIEFLDLKGKKIWGHDIKSMYNKVSQSYPDILWLLSNQNNYRDAKILFFDSNDIATNIFIPDLEDMYIRVGFLYLECNES